MLYPLMDQTKMQGEARFTCKRLQQEVTVAACLDWFVDHNALCRKASACFKCPQGQKTREEFARS